MLAEHDLALPRRTFLLGAASLAATALGGCQETPPAQQPPGDASTADKTAPDRRRLGSLEVSSLGLGCQNVSRTYQATVPNRPRSTTRGRIATILLTRTPAMQPSPP